MHPEPSDDVLSKHTLKEHEMVAVLPTGSFSCFVLLIGESTVQPARLRIVGLWLPIRYLVAPHPISEREYCPAHAIAGRLPVVLALNNGDSISYPERYWQGEEDGEMP